MFKRNYLIVILTILLMLAFTLTDFFHINTLYSNIIKYLSVIVLFMYQITNKNKTLLIAQAIILFNDFILLFTNYDYAGIIGFIVVQLLYVIYLTKNTKPLYLIMVSLITCILYFVDRQLIVGVYIICSLVSLAIAITNKNQKMIIAIILLMLCDINVGLYNLNMLLPYSMFLMWIFYLPSQLFICLEAVDQ